jgi:hypothetical protein
MELRYASRAATLAAVLLACPIANRLHAADTPEWKVLPGQRILLKGDSITRGFAFGNYDDPSPLRTIPGIAAILLKDNRSRPVIFQRLDNLRQGPDGPADTVDSLAAELNACIRAGELRTGDWLIYEDAGQIHLGYHSVPWKKDLYLNYRRSLREMVRAIEDVVDRSHIVLMTMFDYDPSCANCKWDAPLDMVGRTGNDAIRDEAAELGIRVIDMNAIMDAADAYLREKGWGRPVGPDGVHPNVIGNYVMALAILGELGADLGSMKLEGLYSPLSQVPSIWGFKRNPTQSERIGILQDLRAIVAVELQRTKREVEPPVLMAGPARVIRHGRVLDRATHQPQGTTRPVVYELGKLFQLDRENSMLVASLREQGGHDFAVGNDAFVFQNLHDIVPEKAIPINRLDPHYRLKQSDAPAVQGRYPASGGFVPLGAMLPNGMPHPAAGSGILFSGALTFAPDRKEGHAQAAQEDRSIEVMHVRWNGAELRVTRRELITQIAGVNVGRVALSNCLADGAGFLCPFAAHDGSYIVVVRFEFTGGEWRAIRAGKPFISARIDQTDRQVVYRWMETEPSIQVSRGRYVLYTRGRDVKGRVYSSADGLNFELLFDRYNYNAPQTLNQGLDGSMYLITNRGPGLLRNPLLAFPLRGRQFTEPWVVHDERRVRTYPTEPHIPFCDHGIGFNLFLEGRWRHIVTYRVTGLHETDGQGAPPGATTGLYLAELEYERVTQHPDWF